MINQRLHFSRNGHGRKHVDGHKFISLARLRPFLIFETHVQGVLVNGDDFSLGSRPESDANVVSWIKMSVLRVMTLVQFLREDIAYRDRWVSHEPCYHRPLIL